MENSGKLNMGFWLHAFITFLAWVGPFLFNWKAMLLAYVLVILQHIFLGKCLLNDAHGTAEEDYNTFYGLVLELLGFRPDKKRLHFLARRVFLPALAGFTIFWQVGLGVRSLVF